MHRVCATLVVLLVIAHAAMAHVCLMAPPQRGVLDVSGPGTMSCFQPQGPCGTIAPATPAVTVAGGLGQTIFFQQNANHYNPGWPGYFDIAYSTDLSNNATFKPLTVISDYWSHEQAKQTNFSVVVTMPNIDCEHCVLRIRYNPNKPTEPIFHQCSDIKITKTAAPPKLGRMFAFAQYGTYQDAYLVEITLDGQLKKLVEISNGGVRSGAPGAPAITGFSNGLAGINVETQELYFMSFASSDLLADGKALKLMTYDVERKEFVKEANIETGAHAQWNALVSNPSDSKTPAYLIQQENMGSENFRFNIHSVSMDSEVTTTRLAAEFPTESTFVNYFWAEVDHARSKLYVLSGDENSLFKLNVRLYTVDLKTNNVTWVTVANAQFTVTSLHVDVASGNILALSPGLFPQSAYAWTLVSINAATGAVRAVGTASPAGQYSFYYGGAVYGSGITASGHILHEFRTQSTGASVLGFVDKATGKVQMSTTLNTGLNNYISLNTITYLPAK